MTAAPGTCRAGEGRSRHSRADLVPARRPDRRLSSAALDALEEAAVTDGVVVSVASVVDLWYVIRTRQTFTDDQLGELVGLPHDPSSPLAAAPVTLEVAAAFRRIPRDALGDPWDRCIGAAAMALELPVVTRDRR